MKVLKFCLVLSVIALFVFACSENKPANSNTTATTNKPAANANTTATTQPTAAVDELASAKKIYSEKCVKCHKEDGTGGVTEIDGTKIKAPNFTSDRLKKEVDSEFIETIEKGATDDGMPAFKGKISDQDIKDLVKLIRRDFQKQ
ncbi:MAG TPA: cytochrome c [Pyrinomonadaceae bacterium]|nr:cytochrome c [Pyrinomonadaceae bacterium]